MNRVQVPRGSRLGHELPNAHMKGAVDDQIGTRACAATFVLKGGPFAENGRRVEINMGRGTGDRRAP